MKAAKNISITLLAVFAVLALIFSMAIGIIAAKAEDPTVDTGAYKAQIEGDGNRVYPTLKEAIAAANAGETVKLLDSVTLSENLTIGKNLTLDLNEKTVYFDVQSWLTVDNTDADVTIKNGTVDYIGTVGGVPTVKIVNSKSVVLDNVSVTSKSNYAIYAATTNTGALRIVNCKDISSKRYGVRNDGTGSTSIENCKITCAGGSGVVYGVYHKSTGGATLTNSEVICSGTFDKVYGMYFSGSTENVAVNNCKVTAVTSAAGVKPEELNSTIKNIFGICVTGLCTGNVSIGGENTVTVGLSADSAITGKNLIGYGIYDEGLGETDISGKCAFSGCATGIYLWKEPTDKEKAKATIHEANISGDIYHGITNSGTSEVTVRDSVIDLTDIGNGISGNGNRKDTNLKVINTTINAGCGIFHPQDGKIEIDGGTINGKSVGVEVRSGELILKNNAAISVPDTVEYTTTANGNGYTTTGAALSISQHTTNNPIKVTIENAVLSAKMALVQVDLQGLAEPKEVTIAVNDGEFTGGVFSNRVMHFISGGEFSEPPDKNYLVENAVSFHEENGKYLVLSDVEQAKMEASYYIRLYAAARNVEYTEEIDAIVFDGNIRTVIGVDAAKKKAIEKVDAMYGELKQAKLDAIAEITAAAAAKDATETEEAQPKVPVPAAAIAAVNAAADIERVNEIAAGALAEIEEARNSIKSAASAVETEKAKAIAKIDRALDGLIISETEMAKAAPFSDGLTETKRETLQEMYGGEAAALLERHYKDAIADASSATTVEEARAAADNFESRVDTLKILESISSRTSMGGIYAMLAIAIALSAAALTLVIVLFMRNNGNAHKDGAKENNGKAGKIAAAEEAACITSDEKNE